MATPTVFVYCGNNCRYEGMTKEQILTAIMQAVQNGEIRDVDAGFVTTLQTINGKALKFFYGPQAEYDALTEEQKEGLFALITNDTTKAGLLETLARMQEQTEILEGRTVILEGRADSLEGRADSLEGRADSLETSVNNIKKGTLEVGKAAKATKASADGEGNSIYKQYISLLHTPILFVDTAIKGVEIYTSPCNTGSGDVFIAFATDTTSTTYSFGLIWYRGGTVFTQCVPIDGQSTKVYFLKIEQLSVYDESTNGIKAKVTLWTKNSSNGNIEQIQASGYTISVMCTRYSDT